MHLPIASRTRTANVLETIVLETIAALVIATLVFACKANDKASDQANDDSADEAASSRATAEPAVKTTEPAASAKAAEPAATASAPEAKAAAGPALAATPEPAATQLAGHAPTAGAAGSPKPTEAKAAEPPAAPTPAKQVAPVAAQERRGALVSDVAFSTYLRAQSPAKVGESVSVDVVLKAKPPYHCNAEYPHKFKLGAAPQAVSYPSAIVRGMKVTEKSGLLHVPVTAKSAGKATIAGKLSFSVCTDERCLIEKRDLSVDVDIVN